MLGSTEEDLDKTNDQLSTYRLDPGARDKAVQLVKMAAALQYTVFGIPSVYYGDELGLEGARDPFCRMPMPWHEIHMPWRAELLSYYQKLGQLRAEHPALDGGAFEILYHDESCIAYARRGSGRELVVVASRHEQPVTLPICGEFTDLLSGEKYQGNLCAKPDCALILERIGGEEA
jgi:glycosidase